MNQLLHDLRKMNEQQVGDNCLEMMIYYSTTGLDRLRMDAFRNWVEAYFGRRANPYLVTPRDDGDPFWMYWRMVDELHNLLGDHSARENTLNFIALSRTLRFARWFLYDRLWLSQMEVSGRSTWPMTTVHKYQIEGTNAEAYRGGWEWTVWECS